jgi:hypothetical protein
MRLGKRVYVDIWIDRENEEDACCDICLTDTYDDKNDKIFYCDGCNAATHQSCYGRDLLDKDINPSN